MSTPPKGGTHYRPLPLDFLILDLLPDKGMIGGVHWRGRRAKDVYDELVANQPELKGMIKPSMVTARLRSMHVEGHCEHFIAATSPTAVWARTLKGTDHLRRKEEILGA